ncbi:hypothetical protein H920_12218 [Fukomys damarensis]|uniref:Uncharacterized protein n=1 Tax=Fukomys damarensis TaxID=885580 RepID=A0A091DUE3_FUKDA|nr:hypothetical protein H920_12218 [Fukomys damarensis]
MRAEVLRETKAVGGCVGTIIATVTDRGAFCSMSALVLRSSLFLTTRTVPRGQHERSLCFGDQNMGAREVKSLSVPGRQEETAGLRVGSGSQVPASRRGAGAAPACQRHRRLRGRFSELSRLRSRGAEASWDSVTNPGVLAFCFSCFPLQISP